MSMWRLRWYWRNRDEVWGEVVDRIREWLRGPPPPFAH